MLSIKISRKRKGKFNKINHNNNNKKTQQPAPPTSCSGSVCCCHFSTPFSKGSSVAFRIPGILAGSGLQFVLLLNVGGWGPPERAAVQAFCWSKRGLVSQWPILWGMRAMLGRNPWVCMVYFKLHHHEVIKKTCQPRDCREGRQSKIGRLRWGKSKNKTTVHSTSKAPSSGLARVCHSVQAAHVP